MNYYFKLRKVLRQQINNVFLIRLFFLEIILFTFHDKLSGFRDERNVYTIIQALQSMSKITAEDIKNTLK